MTDYRITTRDGTVITWTESTLQTTLEGVASFKGRDVQWLRGDLSVADSNWFSRFIFALFCCLRECLFGTDLNRSKELLEQLKTQVTDPRIREALNRAIATFNSSFSRYKIEELPPSPRSASDRLVAPTPSVSNTLTATPALPAIATAVRSSTAEREKPEGAFPSSYASAIAPSQSSTVPDVTASLKRIASVPRSALDTSNLAKPYFRSIKELITQWGKSKFNVDTARYVKDPSFDEREMAGLLKYYRSASIARLRPHFIGRLDYNIHEGFIKKMDLPKGSKICLKADVHGDLHSVLRVLEELPKLGLLDSNYRCKPTTHFVFLGDYMDRGFYSHEALQLLLTLDMENENRVALIRGNHESVDTSGQYEDKMSERDLKFFHAHRDSLEEAYQMMPLTVYMGQTTESRRIEEVMFTHGLFKPTMDPTEMLEKTGNAATAVPIKGVFTARVTKLARLEVSEDDLHQQKRDLRHKRQLQSEACDKMPAELDRLSKQIEAERDPTVKEHFRVAYNATMQSLEKGKNLIKTYSEHIRACEVSLAARNVMKVYQKYQESGGEEEDEGLTLYNWGDMVKNGEPSSYGRAGSRRFCLSVEEVEDYLILSSTPGREVMMMNRGHQHFQMQHGLSRGVVVDTLPVAGDCAVYRDRFGITKDVTYILTVGDTIRDWKKQILTRDLKTDRFTLSEEMPLQEHFIPS